MSRSHVVYYPVITRGRRLDDRARSGSSPPGFDRDHLQAGERGETLPGPSIQLHPDTDATLIVASPPMPPERLPERRSLLKQLRLVRPFLNAHAGDPPETLRGP